jgi:MFS family permease
MTAIAAPPTQAPASAASATPAPPMALEPRQWLAALAILFVFFTPYQTLVQTVITDDAVRKGIEADDYDMTWVTVGYGVGVIYGVFAGLSLSLRIGKRYTLVLAMLVFSFGNVLCGAATGLVSLALARFVEGFGKMLAMAICRVTLYKQFERALLVAIGFYGVFAYATRHITPLVNAYLDVYLSWRWMYWAYVPVGLAAAALVWRFIRPDRPAKPIRIPMDWLAVTVFVTWIVAIVFAFAWYRKWGGWSSNEFVATVVLCIVLPLVLVAWLGSGFSPDEHLNRILRSRVYVLSLTTRGLMLLHMVAVLTIVGMYCTELRGYPRITAGWLMVPTSMTMAATTFLTTWFHRRLLRHVWLVTGFVGSAACVWWLSSIDNFTPKEHIPVMLACWGAFVGLIPPVFLTDEIEGLDPKDMLYAGAIGIIGLVVPIITVPTATGTVIKAWSDRALDVYRLNLRENRPAVEQGSARVADYFHQRGLSGADLKTETSKVLGGFAALESVAHGFRSGLRFLSLMMLLIGLAVAIPLARAAKGLRAPPGSGYR